MMPALPPQLALHNGKTADEILADLNKSPLFMTDLEENDDTAALQALAYEGSPLENATDFKERGNECFKARRWADAREFYSKGIAIVAAEDRRRAAGLEPPREGDPDGDKPAEIAAQRGVVETLYVNRAACHLELQNYRSCWLDCGFALRINPRNLKAYYRSAKALLAVGRVEEADDACAHGLAIDESSAALKSVARDIIAKAEAAEAKAKKESEAALRAKRRALLLEASLQARNITVRMTGKPPDMGGAKMELMPDPDDARSTLSIPTVLLYPVHLESDFIKAFKEDEMLDQHFGYVFPLPWDREGVYTAAGVECFLETVTGGLVKVGKRVPLLKVLGKDNIEVVDGVVKIFVVPKSRADTWICEFKAAKAEERAKAT